MRVLVTRPEADARRSAARIESLGHEAVIVPLFEIAATGATMPEGAFDRLLATSAHAFPFALPDALRALPTDVVGERTAAAARAAGCAQIAHVAADARTLGVALARERLAPSRFLYLAGRERRPDLEAALAALGHSVTPWIVYETRECAAAPARLEQVWRDGGLDAVLHFSPRSAALYVALAAKLGLSDAAMAPVQAAISPRAAQALHGAREIRIAASPDLNGLLACL